MIVFLAWLIPFIIFSSIAVYAFIQDVKYNTGKRIDDLKDELFWFFVVFFFWPIVVILICIMAPIQYIGTIFEDWLNRIRDRANEDKY